MCVYKVNIKMIISEYSCLDGYTEIKNKLGDSYETLNLEYKGYLEELRDGSSEFIVTKGELDVKNINKDTLKRVIGKDGCYFILTTRNYTLDFLWYNNETEKIEFWGPKQNVLDGSEEIKRRIEKYSI
jgi:hypothetical protein